MFPRELSETIFSLSADTESRALSIAIMLDKDGAIEDCEAVTSMVQPKRITYNDLDAQIDEGTESLAPGLADLLEVSVLNP